MVLPVPPGTPQPTEPEATDPNAARIKELDDVMERAAIAANAQRDVEGQETPPAQPARQEAPKPGAQPEEEEDESEDEAEPAPAAAPKPKPATQTAPEEPDEDEAEDEDEEEPAPAPAPTAGEPPKYSRRDAVKFAAELETTKASLAQVQQEATKHQGELATIRESDREVLHRLSEYSGYTREPDGRFRYEALKEKVLKGTATEAERTEVAEMTSWHEFAGPIYREAQTQIQGAFAQDWKKLQELDGVGAEGLAKLNAAPDGIAATRELHSMAYAAGQAKAKAEADGTIRGLRAQIKSLKTTRVVTTTPQPATTAGGLAVPSSAGFLEQAIDPSTGLPRDDFDKQVDSGRWLGRELNGPS